MKTTIRTRYRKALKLISEQYDSLIDLQKELDVSREEARSLRRADIAGRMYGAEARIESVFRILVEAFEGNDGFMRNATRRKLESLGSEAALDAALLVTSEPAAARHDARRFARLASLMDRRRPNEPPPAAVDALVAAAKAWVMQPTKSWPPASKALYDAAIAIVPWDERVKMIETALDKSAKEYAATNEAMNTPPAKPVEGA